MVWDAETLSIRAPYMVLDILVLTFHRWPFPRRLQVESFAI